MTLRVTLIQKNRRCWFFQQHLALQLLTEGTAGQWNMIQIKFEILQKQRHQFWDGYFTTYIFTAKGKCLVRSRKWL
jgi:hypothetical protein